MQQYLNITLHSGMLEYKLQLTGDMTIKQMAQKYANKSGVPFEQISKSKIVVHKGHNYNPDSDKILSLILKDNDDIFIESKDEEEEGNESIVKRNEEIRNNINQRHNRFRNHIDEDEKEEVKDILKDMATLGCIENDKIENEKNDPNKFISIDECINSNDDQFFILGIMAKYLQNIGIESYIEKADVAKNEEEQDYANTLLQFICNGYILKHKHIIDLTLNPNRIKMLNNNTNNEKDKLFTRVKETLSKFYKIEEDKIIVLDHRKFNDKYTLIIIFKCDIKPLTKQILRVFYKKKIILDFKTITNFCEKPIIESIRLNKSMLDARGNNKSDSQWGYLETRGGFDYLPPVGWHRYGLKVFYRYDKGNNDWLSYDNRPGEWSIAYSGLSSQNTKNTQEYEYDMDTKNYDQKVGIGVYTFQNPKIMEEKTEIVNANGVKYKMGFMLRVKPNKIRIPQSNQQIWVINGTSEEIRPYGILLKKINY